MTPKQRDPNEIVQARRKAGYGDVNTPHGFCAEGDTIPMRYEEVMARDDFDLAEPETPPAAPATTQAAADPPKE